MRKSFFVTLLIALTVSSGMVSCARSSFVNKRDAGTLIGITDLSVRWSPSKPAIGDLVHLEARLSPGVVGAANNVGAFDLNLPNGETIEPLSHDYGTGEVTVRWSFRVKAAGDYALGGKKLFSAVSVAGDSTELKEFDANGLWNGRIEKAERQTAPQAVPANGSAAPANGTSI